MEGKKPVTFVDLFAGAGGISPVVVTKDFVLHNLLIGIFAADRSIRDYADNIWHIKPIEAKNNKK